MRVVEAALLGLAALTVLFMMGLTGADVIGRHLLDAPLIGAFELTEFAMAISVFSALPIVTLRRGHIAADLFFTKLGPRTRRLQRGFTDLIGTVVFGLVAWRLAGEGIEVREYGTTAGTLALPLAPLTFYAAALSGVTAAVFAAHLFGLTAAPDDGDGT